MNNFFNLSCKKPEQKINIVGGKLTKEIKNLEDKREEEVRKLEEKLNQVSFLFDNILICLSTSLTYFSFYNIGTIYNL